MQKPFSIIPGAPGGIRTTSWLKFASVLLLLGRFCCGARSQAPAGSSESWIMIGAIRLNAQDATNPRMRLSQDHLPSKHGVCTFIRMYACKATEPAREHTAPQASDTAAAAEVARRSPACMHALQACAIARSPKAGTVCARASVTATEHVHVRMDVRGCGLRSHDTPPACFATHSCRGCWLHSRHLPSCLQPMPATYLTSNKHAASLCCTVHMKAIEFLKQCPRPPYA